MRAKANSSHNRKALNASLHSMHLSKIFSVNADSLWVQTLSWCFSGEMFTSVWQAYLKKISLGTQLVSLIAVHFALQITFSKSNQQLYKSFCCGTVCFHLIHIKSNTKYDYFLLNTKGHVWKHNHHTSGYVTVGCIMRTIAPVFVGVWR